MKMRLGESPSVSRRASLSPVAFLHKPSIQRRKLHLCYIDESGTPEIPGTTSHYILAALSIPIRRWKECSNDVESIKRIYALESSEIHVAWVLRNYLEQMSVNEFDKLSFDARRKEISNQREAALSKLQKSNRKLYIRTKKYYGHTEAYVHLSRDQRRKLILDLANCVSKWKFARLFAECIDKSHFDPVLARKSPDEQALEQIVSRFENYLRNISSVHSVLVYGLLIHDNNQAVSKRHTELMKKFHVSGTLWTTVNHIIETPLFVDSQLTSMVQTADLCAYALRRYLENKEEELFDIIFRRADRAGDVAVGVRHFTDDSCQCRICAEHRKPIE